MQLPMNYDKATPFSRKKAREEYVRRQKGKCMHCGCDLDKDPPHSITKLWIKWDMFPPNFLKYPVHLQHNHETGMTEGAVHAYCNAVLWQYYGR